MAIDPMVMDDIVAQIKTGRCVAFLGAGVNATVKPPFTPERQPYDGLPLGSAVASRLSAGFVGEGDKPFEELVAIDPALEEAKAALLERVAQEMREELGRNYADLLKLRAYDLPRVALHAEVRVGKRSLVARLREILKDGEDVQPSLLLRTLARLPFRLIITTNYDRLLEKAFEVEGQPEPIVVTQPKAGFSPASKRHWDDRLDEVVPKTLAPRRVDQDPEPAIVYEIHGSFRDDAAGLVVSEDDYVQFLATMSAGGKRGMPRLISQMVVDSSLLLLGYGLEDWDFRTIYKALIEGLPRDERWMSYAIQREPTPLWVDFWAGKNVKIFDHDLVDFANDLRRKFQLADVVA